MATDAPTEPTRTYRGSCHCQRTVFTVTLPRSTALRDNLVCNCSHCLKQGIVWGFTPPGYKIEFEKGKDGLTSYEFGARTFKHYVRWTTFCKSRGRRGVGL
jgi:hypothetical protein